MFGDWMGEDAIKIWEGGQAMTKKQETIERLNRFKTIKVLYGNTFAMTTEQLRTLQEDIETVLNMLKEKRQRQRDRKI